MKDLCPVRAMCAVLGSAPDYGIGEGRGCYTEKHDEINERGGDDIRPGGEVQCVSVGGQREKDIRSTEDALGDGGGVEDGGDGPDNVQEGVSNGSSPDGQSQSQP